MDIFEKTVGLEGYNISACKEGYEASNNEMGPISVTRGHTGGASLQHTIVLWDYSMHHKQNLQPRLLFPLCNTCQQTSIPSQHALLVTPGREKMPSTHQVNNYFSEEQ